MFPEGTRSKDGSMNFKTGVSLISHSAKAPVIPVGIVAEDNFKFRSKVHIVYGEPIYFNDYYGKTLAKDEYRKLTSQLEDAVQKAIDSVKEE